MGLSKLIAEVDTFLAQFDQLAAVKQINSATAHGFKLGVKAGWALALRQQATDLQTESLNELAAFSEAINSKVKADKDVAEAAAQAGAEAAAKEQQPAANGADSESEVEKDHR